VFDVSNDGINWHPAVRLTASTGTAFVVTNGEAVLTGQNAGMVEYADHATFRASPAPADGAVFRIISPPGEFRYSSSTGAGWADDDDTLLKPASVNVNSNGRAYSTRASEHAATFAAFRAMKGLLGRAKHVHVESHTTFGDGGGGIFDIKPVGAYVDNDGTVIVNGTAAGARRGAETGPVPAEWFGVQYDATLAGVGSDSTDALFAALAYANGLADGVTFETGEGDHAFGTTGRRNRPVRISGPCRVTRKIPVRWRGVQIIGDLTGTDDDQIKSSCIFIDHDDMGLECWTGDNVYTVEHPEYILATSLSLEGLGVIRTTAHRAACLDGISVDGANWFMGLRVWNCSVAGHRNGAKVQSTYYATGPRIISNIVLGGRSYFEYNRERGVDIQFYCQLSDIRSFSCWKNTLGGFRIWSDASVVESIDLEGGGDSNELSLLGCRSGGFYTEATTPGTEGFVELLDCKHAIVESVSTKHSDLVGYRVQGGDSIKVTDRLPVRPHNCSDVEAPSGVYPPQTAAADTGSAGISHNLTKCRYLDRQPSVSTELLTDVKMVAYAPYYNTSALFDGVNLPAQICGAVGVPTHAVSTGSIARTCTAGHIYMIAYAIKYAHKPVNNASLYHGCYVHLDESGSLQTPLTATFGASRIEGGDTIQVIGFFVPTATATACKVYIFPYGEPFAGNADYGAAVSEVYTAELTALKGMPLVHVPTLIRGKPFVGTVALNGATPVTLADAGVKATSSVRTERTAIGGTMGAYNTAWTAGVGYTLTGTAGDTSTITVSRDC
jgi:hypothetical protein